jgi:hypothetical protein
MTRFIRQTPCAVLLTAQLVGIVLYPFLEGWPAGRQTFALFGILVMAVAVYAIRATPGLVWVAAGLALPAVALLLAQVITGNQALIPWASAWEAALYAYGAGAMMLYMLDDEDVTTDELFAIVVAFTLLGWAFAHVYVVVQALDPGALAGERSWMELLFLSFTSLTATGLSDIVPVSGHARSVAVLEMIAGVLYVAMVVARLVGLRATRLTRP